MPRDRDFYTRSNRAAWQEVAPRHAHANEQRLLAQFGAGGHVSLEDHMRRALAKVALAGARVAQIGCNNGKDLLSVKSLGAGECVGFDHADGFIEQARRLASAAGLDDVRFETSDLYALGPAEHGTFDLTMTTIGVVGWMPDLQGFFDTVASLTRDGGHYLMEEMHPALLMWEPGADGAPSYLARSYFAGQVFEERSGLDYFTGETYTAAPYYSFQYTLAELMTGAMSAGFVLRHIEELPYDISLYCADLEQRDTAPPLGITLVWKKCQVD